MILVDIIECCQQSLQSRVCGAFSMITEEGIVQQVEPAKAFILINRSSACAGCHSQSVCQPPEQKEMIVEAINDVNARVGDRVQISVPAVSLLKATFIVYFVPVLALILGAIAGSRFAPLMHMDATLASIVCGVSSMIAVFAVVKWFDRSATSKSQYWPRVTRVLPPLQAQCTDGRMPRGWGC